jgi:hypothetical protein
MLDGPDDELRCIVENAPIKSRVLKWLKVPRAEPSISGTIKIQKHSDKKVVDSSIIVSDDGQQTLTPIVGFGAAFTVMYYCHEKHSIVIGSPETEEFEKERLLDGDYDLLLQIVHSRKSELFCRKISISDNSTIIKVFD